MMLFVVRAEKAGVYREQGLTCREFFEPHRLPVEDSVSDRLRFPVLLDQDSASCMASRVGPQRGIDAAPRSGMEPLRAIIGALLLALVAHPV
jgi:hypothetical protein